MTATSTRAVSMDGQTMTVTTKGTTEKGVAYDNILVFHKPRALGLRFRVGLAAQPAYAPSWSRTKTPSASA